MLEEERQRDSGFIEVDELEVFEGLAGSVVSLVLRHKLHGHEVVFQLLVYGQGTNLIVNRIE